MCKKWNIRSWQPPLPKRKPLHLLDRLAKSTMMVIHTSYQMKSYKTWCTLFVTWRWILLVSVQPNIVGAKSSDGDLFVVGAVSGIVIPAILLTMCCGCCWLCGYHTSFKVETNRDWRKYLVDAQGSRDADDVQEDPSAAGTTESSVSESQQQNFETTLPV